MLSISQDAISNLVAASKFSEDIFSVIVEYSFGKVIPLFDCTIAIVFSKFV